MAISDLGESGFPIEKPHLPLDPPKRQRAPHRTLSVNAQDDDAGEQLAALELEEMLRVAEQPLNPSSLTQQSCGDGASSRLTASIGRPPSFCSPRNDVSAARQESRRVNHGRGKTAPYAGKATDQDWLSFWSRLGLAEIAVERAHLATALTSYQGLLMIAERRAQATPARRQRSQFQAMLRRTQERRQLSGGRRMNTAGATCLRVDGASTSGQPR
jgi:hypothetical protein